MKNLKWRVKFWNDSLKDFQTFYYPTKQTALMVAQSYAEKFKTRIFVTNGTLLETFVIGSDREWCT